MENLPKIVLKRMQSPPPESHPDADLLTAFAERALAAPELDHILDHLAHCQDCREVLSLALPPQRSTEVQTQPLDITTLRWPVLRWPVLRWTAVAAGVLLITSIGMLQYRREHGRDLASNVFDAKRSLPAAAPRTQVGKQESSAPAAVPRSKSAPSGGTAFGGGKYSSGVSAGAPVGSAARAIKAAPRPGLAFAKTLKNPAPNQPQNPTPGTSQQQVAASADVVEVQAGTAPVTAQAPQNQAPQNRARQIKEQPQLAQKESLDQSTSSADQLEAVDKAKPALPQAATMAPAPSLRTDPALTKGLGAPRWTISASGALQRSLDRGKTWLDVNVVSDESTAANFVQPATSAAANSKLTEKKSADKQSAPAPPVVFRALFVSSNAAEVWAGGSGGALYHTLDGGNRWTRVVPSSSGIVLTGNITGIQFSDPQNGTVTTSDAEVWTTTDAGQTWRKQ